MAEGYGKQVIAGGSLGEVTALSADDLVVAITTIDVSRQEGCLFSLFRQPDTVVAGSTIDDRPGRRPQNRH